MTDNAYSAGENVARFRYRRRLTQEQLAERAELSLSTVKAIERGARTGRMATLNRLARALGVTTSDLLAPDRGASVAHESPLDALLAVRKSLTPPLGIEDEHDAPAPDLEAWNHTFSYAERLYFEDKYDAVLDAVPVLLEEARAIGQPFPLAQAHLYAGKILTQLRQLDLANHALDKAMGLADELSDDLLAGWIVDTQCWTFLLQQRFPDVDRLAAATADRIEPRMSDNDTTRIATWGWLMTKASAAAIRDARVEDAGEYMRMAQSAAARLGDRPADRWMPAKYRARTVAYKEVENAVLLEDYGRALELAERIPPPPEGTGNSYNRHGLDIATAHLAEHHTDDAIEKLLDIRQVAPEWLRHQGYARGLVSQLVETRRRAYADEVGLLADHVGVVV